MAQITSKMLEEQFGLTVTSSFVPYSKSRNFKEGAFMNEKSLNWKVSLLHEGRLIVTTDYSAGIGHAPSYKNHNPKIHGMRMSILHASFLAQEIETGKEANAFTVEWSSKGGKDILPDAPSVVWSLLLDSDVLEYRSFEEWADATGYDPDSRKAEGIYKACMEIALQMRQIGDSKLAQLRELFQDF